MVIYYVADRETCDEVRVRGFTDGSRMVEWEGRRWIERGVWFSDSPAPDNHQGWLALQAADFVPLAVAEDDVIRFEVPDVDAHLGPRRRWYLPASVANRYFSNLVPVA